MDYRLLIATCIGTFVGLAFGFAFGATIAYRQRDKRLHARIDDLLAKQQQLHAEIDHRLFVSRNPMFSSI